MSSSYLVNFILSHMHHICFFPSLGIVTASMFISWQILLNEVAPRPHNSGHHTIESCYTSQFEQHLRAVVGLPLGDTSMKTPAAVMYNILGEGEVIFCLYWLEVRRRGLFPRALLARVM